MHKKLIRVKVSHLDLSSEAAKIFLSRERYMLSNEVKEFCLQFPLPSDID